MGIIDCELALIGLVELVSKLNTFAIRGYYEVHIVQFSTLNQKGPFGPLDFGFSLSC